MAVYEDDPYVPSKYAKYICGVEPWPEDYGIIIKSTGHILSDYEIKDFWVSPEILIKAEQMEKEADMIGKQRLVKMAEQQKSGTIQIMITQGLIQTHMTMIIDWSNGYLKPGPPINYPDGAPEFKAYEVKSMSKIIEKNSLEDNRFKTISDFKWCVNSGGEIEIEFEYNDRVFGIFPKLKRTSESGMQMLICEKFVDNQQKTEKWCKDADEILEYMIDGKRLRDIITKVKVTDRTI